MTLNSEDADLELRDAVLQVLEESGALNKIKAELRCRVFQALYDSKQLAGLIPPSKASQYVAGSEATEGRLALSLMKDLLQQLNLTFTLSVFEAELHKAQTLLSRKETAAALGLDTTLDQPLISALLQSRQRQAVEADSAPLVQRSSSQLNTTEVKNMFAEQSFFAQLDKHHDGEREQPQPNDERPTDASEKSKEIMAEVKASDVLREPFNKKQITGERNTPMPDSINENKDLAISPSQSPEVKEERKLSPLKPLSSLKNLPQLQVPSKLPSLIRPPQEPIKPVEGDSGDDAESLGDDLLASLDSDSATMTRDVSTSLAEIPGGDYVENVASIH